MVRCSMGALIERGFTLVELIVIMIVLGILAVTILPRFTDRASFDARGFHDQTLSILRYAQKSAVAQRRRTCVAFGADSSVTVTVATNFGDAACDPIPLYLVGPDGKALNAIKAPTTGGFKAQPADLSFLPSGAVASAVLPIIVKGMETTPITVVAATGYVY